MTLGPRRRVYKEVGVEDQGPDGHGLILDGRPFRTPGRRPLAAPTAALAEAIAEEWRAQGETIEPATMPLTQLACTALDLIAAAPEATRSQIADYAGHELLCYRVSEPAALAARQAAIWDPLLIWAEEICDGQGFELRSDLDGKPQSAETCSRFNAYLAAADSWRLAALVAAVTSSGSAILGRALIEGRIAAQACFEAAELDTLYQIELWGEDREARQRLDGIAADLASARRFAELLRS